MIANIQSKCVSSSQQQAADRSKILTIGQAARQYNIHANSLRRYCDSGKLSCLLLPSGHRRIREKDLLSFLGIDEQGSTGGDGAVQIAAVIRVSSRGQARNVGSSDKSSLQHQETRVREFIEERWGEQAVKITWYKSVGSGLNFERPEFLRLVQDVLAGNFRGGFIVATDFSRICRFGIKLFEYLAKLGEVAGIFYSMDERESKSSNETLVDDILAIMTHFTSKISG